MRRIARSIERPSPFVSTDVARWWWKRLLKCIRAFVFKESAGDHYPVRAVLGQ
jgi:hypothetical protein